MLSGLSSQRIHRLPRHIPPEQGREQVPGGRSLLRRHGAFRIGWKGAMPICQPQLDQGLFASLFAPIVARVCEQLSTAAVVRAVIAMARAANARHSHPFPSVLKLVQLGRREAKGCERSRRLIRRGDNDDGGNFPAGFTSRLHRSLQTWSALSPVTTRVLGAAARCAARPSSRPRLSRSGSSLPDNHIRIDMNYADGLARLSSRWSGSRF